LFNQRRYVFVPQSITGRSSGSSFGSFLSWATGTSHSSSLLGGSIQSIWVAYQILRIEQQEREIKTGLWSSLLCELSEQTKTSLDAALKVTYSNV
jgi:hypothetical protein